MPHPRVRQPPLTTAYTFRRPLSAQELLPAVGVGVGVGLAAFYVARLFLQRTPLDIAGTDPEPSRRVAGTA